MVEPARARELWHRLEAVNAVTYFCQECRSAPVEAGLRGFWMGYFACRAAPLGPVGPGVVEATFFNFHPDRVRRAIPDAWSLAAPEALLEIRADAAATALRRLLSDDAALRLAESILPVARRAIEQASPAGRPLFAANRDVPVPADPVAALWQAATTIREHRGDGHVALLTAAGLDGCEAHALFAVAEGAPADLYQQSRGWSDDEWQRALDGLRSRRLLDHDGAITSEGRTLRDQIEQRTDELATQPFADIDDERVGELLRRLDAAAGRIVASGEISFPNPMGLPRTSSPA